MSSLYAGLESLLPYRQEMLALIAQIVVIFAARLERALACRSVKSLAHIMQFGGLRDRARRKEKVLVVRQLYLLLVSSRVARLCLGALFTDVGKRS